MKLTLQLHADLVERALKLTGLTDRSTLVNLGLEALIEKKSRERLALLGGSQPHLKVPMRRRL